MQRIHLPRSMLCLLLGFALTTTSSSAQAQDTSPEEIVSIEGGEPVGEESAATPIVPDASEPPSRAYQLYWEIDVPVLIIGGVLTTGRAIRSHGSAEPAYCLVAAMSVGGDAVCETDGLLFFDEPVAGRWDPTWALVSDAANIAMAVAPALLLAIDGSFLDALNDLVVIYEAGVLASALAAIATKGTGRARPFVYGDEAPLEERLAGDSSLSFFSGHTAFAFAIATATFWTFERRDPDGVLQWVVLGGGLAVAALTGVARVLAGMHFPTDVLAGAAVGASIGTVVPMLHGTPVRVSANANGRGAYLGVTHSF